MFSGVMPEPMSVGTLTTSLTARTSPASHGAPVAVPLTTTPSTVKNSAAFAVSTMSTSAVMARASPRAGIYHAYTCPVANGPTAKKIGFRTDVRMFMALLVGFLVVLILVLLTILQNFHLTTAATIAQQWNSSADTIAAELNPTPDLTSRLSLLRARHGVAAIVLRTRDGNTLTSGLVLPPPVEVLRRNTRAGEALLYFDDSELRSMRRTFLVSAAICIVSSIAATGLLLVYLSRITRPIDAMLDHARELGERGDVEESQYLVDTFRSSIDTLKAQEAELRRLHEAEKTRADDLARVTATLTRSLTAGFLALDANGLVADANRAAQEILGVTSDALNRKPLREAIGASAFTGVVENAFAERSVVARRQIEHRDAIIGLTAVPLRNEEDRFLGMLVLFTDLTPTHALEQRVRDLQNLADLGEISAGIAHEFRNSLSTILGYLKLARRQQPPPEVEGRLRAAEEEALQLADAVGALLQFAKPVKLERQRADLLQLVRDVVGRAEALAPDVSFTVTGDRVEIPADPPLLSRAIENLVRNAVEAVRESGAHGTITATVGAEPVPSITIADNGKGFDESEAARLFLPFQSGKPTGFGLGLPIAKKIVLLHDGTIALRKNEVGGVTARLEFHGDGGGGTGARMKEEG